MSYISSYDYYRTTHPGWGTSQLRFREPPALSFQPLPTWSGWDFYRAHAVNPDQNLYYTVMNRTREFGPNGGAGPSEARLWQRRVYSGLVDLTQLLPQDIGIAAAYEAYRMWKHHRSTLFDPLMTGGTGNVERVREAIVGLAIAEASRLWQYTNRPMDTYGLRDCLESAALTAFRISYTVLQDGAYGPSGGYPAGIADPGLGASAGMPEPYGTDPYNDTYAQDPLAAQAAAADTYDEPYVSSSYRRARRHSAAAPIPGGLGGLAGGPPSPYGGSPLVVPGRAASTGSANLLSTPYAAGAGLGTTPPQVFRGGSPYGGAAELAPGLGGGYGAGVGYAGSGGSVGAGVGYAGSAGGYGGAGVAGMAGPAASATYAMPGVGYAPGMNGVPGGGAYGGGAPNARYGAGGAYSGVAYPGGGAGVLGGVRAGLAAATGTPMGAVQGGYGAGYGGGYGGGAGYGVGGGAGMVNVDVGGGRVIPAAPGSTVVVSSRPRRHSHRHHRSRSVEAFREGLGGREGISYSRY